MHCVERDKHGPVLASLAIHPGIRRGTCRRWDPSYGRDVD